MNRKTFKITKKLGSVLVLVLFVIAGLAWLQWRFHLFIEDEWFRDPALEALAATETKELKGLARRINQFTSLDEFVIIAKNARYNCEESLRVLRQRPGYTGLFIMICSRGEKAPAAGDDVLVVGFDMSVRRPTRLELRHVDTIFPDQWQTGSNDPTRLIAASKGIEFLGVTRLADLVIDRFDRWYFEHCIGDGLTSERELCIERRRQRAKDGPPHWDGKPRVVSTYQGVIDTLQDAGFACSEWSVSSADVASSRFRTFTHRCTISSFSGQQQTVDLTIAAAGSVPRMLTVIVDNERKEIPLQQTPPAVEYGGIRLLLDTPKGEVRSYLISPHLSGSSSESAIKQYATFTEASRQLVAETITDQMRSVLEAPAALPAPQLQRLDVAAAMLSRYGSDAVDRAAKGISDLPPIAVAAIGLASCTINDEAPDCLLNFVSARPAVHDLLSSAYFETKESVNGLAPDHPVQWRLEKLAGQLSVLRK